MPIVSKDYFPSTTAQFITEVDNLPPSATYEAKALTKVDVVFAFGEMSQSQQMQDYMDSFEQRLGSAGNNIDAYVEKVETSTISTSDEDSADIFQNWYDGLANSRPSPYWRLQGTKLTIDYSDDLWDRFVDISDTGYSFSDGSISFYTQSFQNMVHQNQYGVGFRLQNPQMHGGYTFSVGRTRGDYGAVALWELNDDSLPLSVQANNPNKLGISKEYSVDTLANAKYTIKCSGPNIQIYVNSDLAINVNNTKYSKGTYGIWARTSTGGVWFDNFSITTGNSKSLGEAISDVAWRDNSIRFVVYGEDTVPEYMQNTTNADYQYTITKLLNSNAYLIPLGTSTNKSVMEQLIKFISSPTETKGKFINNVPIITAMNSACDWIISLVRNNSKPTQWILVNTPIVWNTTYKDSEHDLPLNFGEHDGQGESLSDKSDTSDLTLASSWGVGLSHYFSNQDKILAEKWRYIHHYTFYDNSTREETFSNVWISDPVEIFPEPGLYRINYKRKDNPFYTDVNLANPFDEYRYWSTDYDPVVQ